MKIRPSKRTLWPVALLLAGLMAGRAETPYTVDSSSDKASAVAPAVSDADQVELVAGNNAFAADLYKALGQKTKGNLFCSPYSISSALAMTYVGARGETEQQMAKTMYYTLPQAKLHPAYSALNADLISLDKEGSFKLRIANALWGQQGFGFLPTYLDTVDKYYSAGLHTVDFVNATETARTTINTWVSDKTQDKIKDLIPQGALTADTRLVLTNAIYFLGKWEAPFTKDSTVDGPFKLRSGKTVNVPMMNQTHNFNFVQESDYKAIELPYRDSNAAMLIVLPRIGQFNEVEAAISKGLVTDIVNKLSMQRVNLALPKFTFTSDFTLGDVLINMGMPTAFGGNADFSGITGSKDLSISQVLHKAFVAVDEEGTEAAAATAVIMELTGYISPVVNMNVNHPFLFVIRDTRNGSILFTGRVIDPSPSSDTTDTSSTESSTPASSEVEESSASGTHEHALLKAAGKIKAVVQGKDGKMITVVTKDDEYPSITFTVNMATKLVDCSMSDLAVGTKVVVNYKSFLSTNPPMAVASSIKVQTPSFKHYAGKIKHIELGADGRMITVASNNSDSSYPKMEFTVNMQTKLSGCTMGDLTVGKEVVVAYKSLLFDNPPTAVATSVKMKKLSE